MRQARDAEFSAPRRLLHSIYLGQHPCWQIPAGRSPVTLRGGADTASKRGPAAKDATQKQFKIAYLLRDQKPVLAWKMVLLTLAV